MLLESCNTPPRRMTEAERLDAACKVAALLDPVSPSAIVPAFLAATLGDVRHRGDHYEACGYGFRATSVRNRAQAVRNWMIAVSAKAAIEPITPVPPLLLPDLRAA